MAGSLAGRPLLVMAESSARAASLDALLSGPQVAFPLRYVICPGDGDWVGALRHAAAESTWLALMHNGRDTLIPGPDYARPGQHACREEPLSLLEDALAMAGWTCYRQEALVDLWRHP
jgi:hypothetical protein